MSHRYHSCVCVCVCVCACVYSCTRTQIGVVHTHARVRFALVLSLSLVVRPPAYFPVMCLDMFLCGPRALSLARSLACMTSCVCMCRYSGQRLSFELLSTAETRPVQGCNTLVVALQARPSTMADKGVALMAVECRVDYGDRFASKL